MSTPPTFLAFLFAREDEGLIVPCIANLREIGFDPVVVYCIEDFAAQAPRLSAIFAKDPGVHMIAVPETVTDASFLSLDSSVFGPPIRKFRPDWIFALDGDEFPVVRGGHIAGISGLDQADALIAPRYNHARRNSETGSSILGHLTALEDIPLIADRQDVKREADEGTPRWLLHRIGPKVLMRPAMFERFIIGNHGGAARADQSKAPVELASRDMVIVHMPFTSYERFERKIENAKAHLNGTSVHNGKDSAWHWKAWIRHHEADALAAEFQRESLSDGEFCRMRDQGAIKTARMLLDDT